MKSKSIIPGREKEYSLPEPAAAPAGKRADKGQSLVETAIILPVFILMLLGVFEVGWALRGYLVLANVNREATRFAARGVYLNLKEKVNPEAVGYDKVISHTVSSLSGQLAFNFEGGTDNNASAIITYYNIEPRGFDCPGDPGCKNFDCSKFLPGNPGYVPGEDLNTVEYPLLLPPPGMETDPNLPAWYKPANRVLSMSNTIPVTAYHFIYPQPVRDASSLSRINPAEKVVELRSKNNELNCQLLKKNLPPTSDNMVVVENIYYQNQLVGFPFVTAFVPDPVPFYTHTAMRMTTNIRSTDTEEASSCDLLPLMIPLTKVNARHQGDTVVIGFNNDPDIIPGNFSFLKWNSDENNANQDIADDLANPSNAGVNYNEPDSDPPPDDQVDMLVDWIENHPGANVSSHIVPQLNDMIDDQVYYFPVYNDFCSGVACDNFIDNSGANGKIRVYTYVAMRIKAVYLNGNNATECGANGGTGTQKKCLVFQFDHWEPGHCPGNGR